MSVSAPFIKRPIATSLLAVAVLLTGFLGYSHLPISSLPQVDFPTIQVTTQLPGANPDTMAALVTAPLERQFGQIPALARMTSQSSYGLSQITLQFELDRDIDAASQDVQSAINAAGSTLPRTLPYPPVYAKVNPADAPIMSLAFYSDSLPLRALSDMADTLIAPRLSEISGVGRVSLAGGVRPAIRIAADLSRLAAYQIGLEDLRGAVVGANVAGSKGQLDGAQQSYTIAANDQIDAAASYNSVIIALRGGAPIFLHDVARVSEGLENRYVGGWYQGHQAVLVDIRRQPGANIVATAERIKAELPHLKGALPSGAALDVINDRTLTIRASIADVQATLVLATVLVVLVVLLFLRSVRATLIAGIALPLSLIAAFGVMNLCGFSLDNLSLMALTIGTGFVVDDAIVMIENIVRTMAAGKKPLEAALQGAREIGFTVISLTVSLIAVFIPLLFMPGLVGRMFREFAVTLSIAVITSAIVSLTLTPMLCAYLLKPLGHHGHARARGARQTPLTRGVRSLTTLFDYPLRWLGVAYARSLRRVLRAQGVMVMVSALTLIVTVWLYIIIPKGFLPRQDTGVLAAVLEGAPDSSFGAMRDLQERVTLKFRGDSAVSSVAATLGVSPVNATQNTAQMTIVLKSKEARGADDKRLDIAALAERLRHLGETVPGARLFIQPVQDVQIATSASRAQYQYTLTGAEQGVLMDALRQLADALMQNPLFAHVALETQDGGLLTDLTIDRESASRLGVSMQNIDDTLYDAFGQRQISTIYAQSTQYRVVLEAGDAFQNDPASLTKLYVSGAGGTPVPLSTLVSINTRATPLSVGHEAQFPAVALSFDLAPGAFLGAAVEALTQAQNALALPLGITGHFAADASEFSRALASEPWLILAAVISIYIVLGMLYESFIHPFTILTTLPSAGVGALVMLLLFHLDLSVVALVGIVLLMGIVKKNAILMIDFALEAERTQGLAPLQSITKACRLRFRPIMMTTLAALFGALPLALASGVGAELRVPLGISITGGLIFSQLLTLYTTPVIYLVLERLRAAFAGRPVAMPQALHAAKGERIP